MIVSPIQPDGFASQAELSDFAGDPLTVAELRERMEQLPSEARVVIGIRDRHRFNGLLGELAVLAASAAPASAGSGSELVLVVDGLS